MRHFCTFELDQVEWAGLMREAPHFGGRKNRSTEAQKAGLRYERKAQEYLMELYPGSYVASPWIAFRLKHEPLLRYCQPDGFVVDIERAIISIIEIKLRHMAEAYTQVTGIYYPTLKKIFPTFAFRFLEVTRFYDPAAHFPVPVQLLSSPDLAPRGGFGVHIYR